MTAKFLLKGITLFLVLGLCSVAQGQPLLPQPPIARAPVNEKNEAQITKLSKRLSCFAQGGELVPGRVRRRSSTRGKRKMTFVSYANTFEKKLKRAKRRLRRKRGRKRAQKAIERRTEKFEERLRSFSQNCEEEVGIPTTPVGEVKWVEVSQGLKKPYSVQALLPYKGTVAVGVKGPERDDPAEGVYLLNKETSTWNKIARTPNRYHNGQLVVLNDTLYSFWERTVSRLDEDGWTKLPELPVENRGSKGIFKAFNNKLYILIRELKTVMELDPAALQWRRVVPEGVTPNPIPVSHVDFVVDKGGNLIVTQKWTAKDLKENRGVVWLYQGSSFVDITDNLDVRDMLGGCCGPLGTLSLDADGVVRVSSEWGVWKRTATGWERVEYYWGNASIKAADESLYVVPPKSSELERHQGFKRWRLSPPTKDASGCRLDRPYLEHHLVSQNNGEDLFIFLRFDKDCGYPSSEMGLLYKMEVEGELSYAERNLPATTATYIGGVGDDEARGAVFTQQGAMVLAGNFGSLAYDMPTPLVHAGATADSAGKVLLMNGGGTTVTAAVSVGDRVDDLDNALGEGDLAVSGSFGVAVMDPEATYVKWSNPMADQSAGDGRADGGQTRVAISSVGKVAVLRDKRVSLFDGSGTLLATQEVGKSYVTDVAIAPDGSAVYVVGFSNQYNEGVPVQVAFVWGLSGVDLSYQWETFDFNPDLLDEDMADTRLYRIAYGHDGKLYVLGESAGGNTIFRWNGKDLSTSKLIKYDIFSDAFNAGAAHFAFFGSINPTTGEVVKGQFIVPRVTSNMKSNSFRVQNGSIAADSEGRVFIGGRSFSGIAGRDLNRVAGTLVGRYTGGDLALLVVSPDFRSRLRWLPFNKEGLGNLAALAVKGSRVAAFGTVDEGEMITHNALQPVPFNPGEGVKDAYLVRWQEGSVE